MAKRAMNACVKERGVTHEYVVQRSTTTHKA